MPFPSTDSLTGYAPAEVTNGSFSTQYAQPDWASPEVWQQAIAEAQRLVSEQGTAQGYGNGVQRTLDRARSTGDLTPLINAIAAQQTPGGQFGNPELANGLVEAGIVGTGIGSVFANLPGAAASTGATGGGLSPISLPSSVAPTGAIPGALGPSIPAGASAATVGPAIAGGAGAFGNFLQNWGPELAGGVNALLGYRAADQAADAESAAAQAAIDEQRRQYDQTRADLQPWMTAGQGALNRLQDPNAFTASPDYNFIRGEGTRGIENSFAARGGAQSGNALRALTEFNSNLAAGDYNNWWNRQAGLAGVGQNATTNVANFGQNTSSNVGNYLAGQGVSRASGIYGKNSSLAGGINDVLTNYLYKRRAA